MALLDRLAEFIGHVSFDNLPSKTVDNTELHIFDSLGATLIGAGSEEANDNLQLIKKTVPAMETSGVPVAGFGFPVPLPAAVLLSCVVTRMTEMDDIDIASCTTPGSVAVPAALSLAFSAGANGRSFVEGVLSGYEIITRLGAAVNGPEILYRGIWPTYLCGAIGVAAVGSKILGLTVEQIKNALAISLSLSTGIAGRIKGGLSSRWLTLGCAAQNGLLAAFAAGRGFSGDVSILDTLFPSIYGLDLKPQVLLEGLGEAFQIEKVNMKPFCTSRQGLASVEAFQWLLKTHSLKPDAIEDMEVIVPQQYHQMIDRGRFPEDRLASITGVQYQLALAAFHEENLFDSERKALRDTEQVRNLMQKVRVKPFTPFTEIFPRKWPGKISLKIGGQRYDHEVLSPRGDADQPMGWEDVERKLRLAIRRPFEPARIEVLKGRVKELRGAKKIDDLLRAMVP